MSVANFIPEITRAEVQVAYDREKVVIATFTAIPDGEIKTGNAVKIFNAGLPTVQDYAAQGRSFTSEEIEATEVTVLIDQEKATSQKVDDIDRRQAAGSLTQFTDQQGVALARDAERFAIATLLAGGTQGSSATLDTAAKIKTALRKLAADFDAAEVPEMGRIALLNPTAKALLVEALGDSTGIQSNGTELRTNQVSVFAGFDVIWSPHFAEKSAAVVVAYHTGAAAFAAQIAETQGSRPSGSFSDVISSLNVYGSKVTRPAAVIIAGIVAAPVAP
ncbi:hypothetical protein [Cryobacterium sp. PH31-O1]|uniref:phage major capsid protein n=1 Tax=Cryobacterium sp. PH31-O1 TaxID=3046306 RepID=UPI0024BA3986|nr:hypothetical protein [Cryobacterium sp. PH31-O1]MDJ0338260.1 hypothetical protein [Cryobacterium sp. PH31-O1]